MDEETLSGDMLDFAAEMPLAERNDAAAPRRGFLNPETLAKAQTARQSRRDAGPEDLSDSEPRAKRGRPPGSTRKRDLAGVEAVLVGVHAMLAASLHAPELTIDAAESHAVAEAVANVAEQYKIRLDGKAGAVAGLVYALGLVYGPRAVAIYIRMRNEKSPPEAARVVHSPT